jgi:hypothetical protein
MTDIESMFAPIDAETALPRIAKMALIYAPKIIKRWLPEGRRHRRVRCWLAPSPGSSDKWFDNSLIVNLETGTWLDYRTGKRGDDLISLAVYIFNIHEAEAARRLAYMVGI